MEEVKGEKLVVFDVVVAGVLIAWEMVAGVINVGVVVPWLVAGLEKMDGEVCRTEELEVARVEDPDARDVASGAVVVGSEATVVGATLVGAMLVGEMLTETTGMGVESIIDEAAFVVVVLPPGRIALPPCRSPPLLGRRPRETLARDAADRLTQMRSAQL